ncbi:MAG: thioredoxin fold domain-containing protein [Chromatiales bacterium]
MHDRHSSAAFPAARHRRKRPWTMTSVIRTSSPCRKPIQWEPVCRLALTLVLLTGPSAASHARTDLPPVFDDSEIVVTHYPDWFKPSFLDLRADLDEALRADRRGLLLFFETDGCAYCAAFVKDVFGDPSLRDNLRAHFDVVGLDIFQDDELTDFAGQTMPVKVFAKREGAIASPTLVFYGRGGERMLRVVGYQPRERFRRMLAYVTGGHYRTESFRAFSARQKPPPNVDGGDRLASDPLFAEPPHLLDRRIPADRPLLVVFERRGCEACRALHDHVLAHPPVRELLQRFEVVRLDADDDRTPVLTPRGERSSPAGWVETLDIAGTPALVFFSKDGSEVLRFESLVLRQRMERALMYVLDGAYRDGTTFQRFTRAKSIESLAGE